MYVLLLTHLVSHFVYIYTHIVFLHPAFALKCFQNFHGLGVFSSVVDLFINLNLAHKKPFPLEVLIGIQLHYIRIKDSPHASLHVPSPHLQRGRVSK